MKNFKIKILLFITPLVVMLIPPMYLLLSTGENFKKIDKMIMKDEPFLIGYAFNEQNYKYLKWQTIMSRPKYDVMALGSSRVLPFRKQMFDASFYNAGYTISSLNDFLPFLNTIPSGKYPDFLIIGIDQWMFNAAWDSMENPVSKDQWENAFKYKPTANTIINVWEDVIAWKYDLNSLDKDDLFERVGMNAVFNNSGFRNDGSFYYGGQIEKLLNNDEAANDYHYENTLDRIEKGDRLFQYGKQINPEAFIELEQILGLCRKNNIQVVAFLPPFATKVNDELQRRGEYEYMNLIYSSSKHLFDRYGAEFYDFSHLETINSDDGETIDGFHGGEVAYLKIMIKMLESDSELNKVSDLIKLKLDLKSSKNRLEIYY